jgi:hypothetical protein
MRSPGHPGEIALVEISLTCHADNAISVIHAVGVRFHPTMIHPHSPVPKPITLRAVLCLTASTRTGLHGIHPDKSRS